MKIRRILIMSAVAVSLASMVSSCGGDSAGESAVTETPEQIDSARNAGREAARKIIVREWRDSMQFQNAVLEARAAKSRYEMAKRQQCVAVFDSAFVSTIRTTRPDLADKLK